MYIYSIYFIIHVVPLVLNLLSNLEFRRQKKDVQVVQIGVGGREFGQNPEEQQFLLRIPSHNLGITINHSHACSRIQLIHCFLKFSPLRMDNYLGRVVGEVAHAGEHKP